MDQEGNILEEEVTQPDPVPEETPADGGQPGTRKGLTTALKTFFGVGDCGFVLMSNVETFYFMTFLTDFAMFAPAIAAVINSVFSIVDACLSWIYGGIINRVKARRWGRYRSWMVMTPWIVPFIFACQFLRIGDNETLSAVLIIIAAIVSHIIWNFGYVANLALINVVGQTPEGKATLASSRATWNNIGGLLFSYLGLPFATLLGSKIGERNQWAAAAFILGWLMVLGYYAHFRMTKGYEEQETGDDAAARAAAARNRISLPTMMKALFQNPHLILLIIADLAKWSVNFVSSASAIYYFRDAAGNPGLMVPYALVIAIAAIVGAYISRFIAAKISTRTTAIIAYAGMTVFLFAIYAAYANPIAVIGLIACARFFYGIAFAMTPALYADTVVYSTWKTGQNASGWIMGLQNLPLKIAIFLRGVIIGAVLVSVGWVSGITLEGTARQAMTISFAVVPAVMCLVGLVILIFGFRLTKKKVEQYQAEIDAREAAE
ncbi:MAG: MFS transporter [Lachnospiraceae bacterium]|nr:MFS transporter [Lachnospiraceae bacterium]